MKSMATITEALTLEHAVFSQIFDQIERITDRSRSVREVKSLASVVEGLLSGHGESETNLAYSVLDHVLAERGTLTHLHQNHQEIDGHFARIRRTRDPGKAMRLLKMALAATREHFRLEEEKVFPLLEDNLESETLCALGSQLTKGNSSAKNVKTMWKEIRI